MEYDRELAETMQNASGVPSITAVGSCIEAMRHMGTSKISFAGPYLNLHLRNLL